MPLTRRRSSAYGYSRATGLREMSRDFDVLRPPISLCWIPRTSRLVSPSRKGFLQEVEFRVLDVTVVL